MTTPDITATLEERGERYGSFAGQAQISQRIKWAMTRETRWEGLANDQKEALSMIAHKIARILNGDPDWHDHWHDICGYSKLVADRLSVDSSPTLSRHALQERGDGMQTTEQR